MSSKYFVNRVICLFAIYCVAASGSVFAAPPSVTVGSAGGDAGSGTPVTIPLTWVPGAPATVAVAQFDISYDASLTADITNCGGAIFVNPNLVTIACSLIAGPAVRVIADDSLLIPIEVTDWGTIDFDVSGAGPGPYPLTVSGEVYGDSAAMPVPSGGSTNGQITLSAGPPSADFTPNPGSTVTVGPVQTGGMNPTTPVSVINDGSVGSLLDVTCTETADPSNAFTYTNASFTGLAQGDPAELIGVTCNAGLAPNTYTGTLSCAHTGGGDPNPSIFNLSCEVTDGPAPVYGSSPIAPGGTFAFGDVAKGDPDPELTTTINNDAGDPLSNLSGSCTITNNPGSAYSISTGGAFDVDQGAGGDVVGVTCESDTAGNFNGGILSCTGGFASSPVNYTLNCVVPPEAEFSSTPIPSTLIDFGTLAQGGTFPTSNLLITNTGDTGSTLTGTCSLVGGGTPISISSGASYSDAAGGGSATVGIDCDGTGAVGTHNDTVSCTVDNDPNFAGPATYPVQCTIDPPGAAVFESSPVAPSASAPGNTLELTPDGAVAEGTDLTNAATLIISNTAVAGSDYLEIIGCSLGGGTPISASPVNLMDDIDPGSASQVNFSCDTTADGDYTDLYTCEYNTNPSAVAPVNDPQGGGVSSQFAYYTIECNVRDAESDVEPVTPSGTPSMQMVTMGGSAQFMFDFTELNDEGEGGTLNCSLNDGSNFSIDSPAFPDAPVASGATVTVTVTGTDPGGVDSITDTLECTYTDSNETDTPANYPLEITIGGGLAQFEVNKTFTDGNPGEVLVYISCNTGLPLDQMRLISAGDNVTFVVGDFDDGEMDCTITEDDTIGYSGEFLASGDSTSANDDDGCHFTAVNGGDNNVCNIVNTPDPVDVVINKEWIIEGDVNGVDTYYQIGLVCETPIANDGPCLAVPTGVNAPSSSVYCKTFEGNAAATFTAQVTPGYPSSGCEAYEITYSDAVESESNCSNLTVSAGEGDSCTITNTVFFEGIPTLSELGLAILALLMLGVGFVAVRRFT